MNRKTFLKTCGAVLASIPFISFSKKENITTHSTNKAKKGDIHIYIPQSSKKDDKIRQFEHNGDKWMEYTI